MLERKAGLVGLEGESLGTELKLINGKLFLKTKDEEFELSPKINNTLLVASQISERVGARWRNEPKQNMDFASTLTRQFDCHDLANVLLNLAKKDHSGKISPYLSWEQVEWLSKRKSNTVEGKDELTKKIYEASSGNNFCLVRQSDTHSLNHSFIAVVSPKGKIYRIEKFGHAGPTVVVPLDYTWNEYINAYGNNFIIFNLKDLN